VETAARRDARCVRRLTGQDLPTRAQRSVRRWHGGDERLGGEPSGVFHVMAKAMVERLVPEPDAEQRAEALRRGQAYLQRHGIGSWLDAIVDPASEAVGPPLERLELSEVLSAYTSGSARALRL
jgi:predicted amidohydrolase YtcJ